MDKRKGRGAVGRQARQAKIADVVVQSGSIAVESLISELDVSSMTVYRDLADLEAQGILHRSRGTVTAASTNLFEVSMRYRLNQYTEQKAALARAAAKLVSPGQSVMLDDSSTGVWVARELAELTPLTVVTNSQAILREMQGNAGVRLFLAGGEYQAWADACFGQTTAELISGIRADVAIMSSTAVTDGICFHPDETVVQVKRAMLESSSTSVLCVDGSKFSRRALHAFAKCTDFDRIFVDSETDATEISNLREAGSTVEVVEPQGPG